MNYTKMGFFLQLYNKRKKNKPTNYLTRQKTLCNNKNLQYNEMNKKRLCNVK